MRALGTRVDIMHDTSTDTVAVWDQVVILATRTALTMDALRCVDRLCTTLAKERPMCMLSVFGQRTQLPDSVTLSAATSIVRESAVQCSARVVPGHGLWATALRGMVNVTAQAALPERPRKTFGAIDEATAWLAEMMTRDMAFRSQLATITGTLVYGSPSWKRESQVMDYLNDGSSDP
jgi:hypothetical protein